LDTEPQEIEALVDVADARLVLRQDKAYRGEHRCHLRFHALGVVPVARDQHHEIVRVPYEPVVGEPVPSSPSTIDVGAGTLPELGEIIVEDRQGHIAEQRGENATL
jgi:hypothetical protein